MNNKFFVVFMNFFKLQSKLKVSSLRFNIIAFIVSVFSSILTIVIGIININFLIKDFIVISFFYTIFVLPSILVIFGYLYDFIEFSRFYSFYNNNDVIYKKRFMNSNRIFLIGLVLFLIGEIIFLLFSI